jgi:hypothetical protein
MAMNFLTKASPETANDANEIEKPQNAAGLDPERQGSRKMRRIDKPVVMSDSDSSLSVGEQIELEKENAIQYRTCSWQKVSFVVAFGYVMKPLTII